MPVPAQVSSGLGGGHTSGVRMQKCPSPADLAHPALGIELGHQLPHAARASAEHPQALQTGSCRAGMANPRQSFTLRAEGCVLPAVPVGTPGMRRQQNPHIPPARKYLCVGWAARTILPHRHRRRHDRRARHRNSSAPLVLPLQAASSGCRRVTCAGGEWLIPTRTPCAPCTCCRCSRAVRNPPLLDVGQHGSPSEVPNAMVGNQLIYELHQVLAKKAKQNRGNCVLKGFKAGISFLF